MNKTNSSDIIVQNLDMQLQAGVSTCSKEVVSGEIDGLKIENILYVGPIKQSIPISKEEATILIFLKGKGLLHTETETKNITPESIAIPMNAISEVTIELAQEEELHFLKFTKKMSPKDIEDLNEFPIENKYDLFFTKFEDCEPYTETIKSANTISRTVLSADIVPRVSLGTVEANGPDKVGAHSHPMLEQLFLGLSGNDITVYADNSQTQLKEYALLHIPLGSNHAVTVDESRKMNYMWMDFFITREGQEWLKTHKPIKVDSCK